MGSLLKKLQKQSQKREKVDTEHVYIDGKRTKVTDWLYRLAVKLPVCTKRDSRKPIDHYAMLLQAYNTKGKAGVDEYYNVILDIVQEAAATKVAAREMGLVSDISLRDVIKYGKKA